MAVAVGAGIFFIVRSESSISFFVVVLDVREVVFFRINRNYGN